MKGRLIDTQEGLNDLTNQINPVGPIFIDTEFIRRSSYYAKLSLLQIFYNGKIFIVDALKLDITSLYLKILSLNKIIVIHSARQDFEIFHRLFGKLPKKVFDTQIAAKFCGFRSSISYSELCEKICNIEIDKSHQNSDWMKRGLSEKQLEYASLDVAYLQEIHSELDRTLLKDSLYEEVDQKIWEELLDPAIYKPSLESAWKKVKFLNKSKYFTERMQLIAAFREDAAVKFDVPKKYIASDKQLIHICNILPKCDQDLKKIKYLKRYILKPEYKKKLFAICEWLGRLDSNQRMTISKTVALPLGYAPIQE